MEEGNHIRPHGLSQDCLGSSDAENDLNPLMKKGLSGVTVYRLCRCTGLGRFCGMVNILMNAQFSARYGSWTTISYKILKGGRTCRFKDWKEFNTMF